MTLLTTASIAIAALAVIAIPFGLPDHWFLGLLSLACLLSGADAAYAGVQTWAAVMLGAGAACAAGAAGAALRDAHRRHSGST